jgi:hypothetical protein
MRSAAPDIQGQASSEARVPETLAEYKKQYMHHYQPLGSTARTSSNHPARRPCADRTPTLPRGEDSADALPATQPYIYSLLQKCQHQVAPPLNPTKPSSILPWFNANPLPLLRTQSPWLAYNTSRSSQRRHSTFLYLTHTRAPSFPHKLHLPLHTFTCTMSFTNSMTSLPVASESRSEAPENVEFKLWDWLFPGPIEGSGADVRPPVVGAVSDVGFGIVLVLSALLTLTWDAVSVGNVHSPYSSQPFLGTPVRSWPPVPELSLPQLPRTPGPHTSRTPARPALDLPAHNLPFAGTEVTEVQSLQEGRSQRREVLA